MLYILFLHCKIKSCRFAEREGIANKKCEANKHFYNKPISKAIF